MSLSPEPAYLHQLQPGVFSGRLQRVRTATHEDIRLRRGTAVDDRSRPLGGADRFAAFSRRQQKRFERFRQFVVGFYSPEFRDIFFNPHPQKLIFRSVVTMLAGKWNAGLWTRFLNKLFFGMISIQKHFAVTRSVFRRDRDAGYP